MRISEYICKILRDYGYKNVTENHFPDIPDFISVTCTTSSRWGSGLYGKCKSSNGNVFYTDQLCITVSNRSFADGFNMSCSIRSCLDGVISDVFTDLGRSATAIHICGTNSETDGVQGYRILFIRSINGPTFIGTVQHTRNAETKRFTTNIEVGYEYY